MSDGDFAITFHHNPKNDICTKFYYAFTFPYTYTELQIRLEQYDELYQKNKIEIYEIMKEIESHQSNNLKSNESKFVNCKCGICRLLFI